MSRLCKAIGGALAFVAGYAVGAHAHYAVVVIGPEQSRHPAESGPNE